MIAKPINLFTLISLIFFTTNCIACYSSKDTNENNYYRCIVDANSGYVNAQYDLGVGYIRGDWVIRDYEEAMKWLLKAANQGYKYAHSSIGNLYAQGNGVEKDINEAIRWYRIAGELGVISAQTKLGSFYYHGEYVDKDLTESVRWYRMAAEQGNPSAQSYMGYFYHYGKGVPQNDTLSAKWKIKAAKQGHKLSQLIISEYYYEGLGVTKDIEKSYYWSEIAYHLGQEGAYDANKKYAQYLNDEKRDKILMKAGLFLIEQYPDNYEVAKTGKILSSSDVDTVLNESRKLYWPKRAQILKRIIENTNRIPKHNITTQKLVNVVEFDNPTEANSIEFTQIWWRYNLKGNSFTVFKNVTNRYIDSLIVGITESECNKKKDEELYRLTVDKSISPNTVVAVNFNYPEHLSGTKNNCVSVRDVTFINNTKLNQN